MKSRLMVEQPTPVAEATAGPVLITDPKATLKALIESTNALGGASGRVRTTLRPLSAPTVEQEVDRLRLFCRQQVQDWGGPMPLLSQLAVRVVTEVEAFLDQVELSTDLRNETSPLLQATLHSIAVRREDGVVVLADLERLNEFDVEIAKVQRAYAGLDHLLKQTETWVRVAKQSAARTAEAAGRIIVTQSVVDVSITLKQMADRIQVLRSSQSPAMGEVLQAIQRAERMNSTHIRLPEVCWPDDGDMFAPPKLREWGTDEESR